MIFVANIICLFPFITNGYTWFNEECRFVMVPNRCVEFQLQRSFFTCINNISFGLVTLFLTLLSIYYNRKNNQTIFTKIENQLIVQSVFSSFCLTLMYLTVIGTTIYIKDRETMIILHYTGNFLFLLEHYPTIIILFALSPQFRTSFLRFYKLSCFERKCVPSQIIFVNVN